MKKNELKDHIAGALYGFAIGDSVGATTEFMDPDQIKAQYGEVTKQIGGGWLNLEPGEVTDDTQMMMCVIDALMDFPDDIDRFKVECACRFIDWMRTIPKDVGATCARGISHFDLTGEFIKHDENLLGNGSLMRYLPCAILKKDDFNIAQGDITHYSNTCASLIQKTSKALWECIKGNYTHSDLKGPQIPSGKVTNTFENAMYHASHGSFTTTLTEAVNNGGDADTIAAISCSLAGARVGLDGINPRLIGPLPIEVKKKFGKFIDFSLDYLFTNNLV